MISCYFILLMKMHKKQNGQLARPFIPQVLAVSFWGLESASPFSGHEAGPTVNCLRSLLPIPTLCTLPSLPLVPVASHLHPGDPCRPRPSSTADKIHLVSLFLF